MQERRSSCVLETRSRARRFGSDRLRAASAAAGIGRRFVVDAARRATFAI